MKILALALTLTASVYAAADESSVAQGLQCLPKHSRVTFRCSPTALKPDQKVSVTEDIYRDALTSFILCEDPQKNIVAVYDDLGTLKEGPVKVLSTTGATNFIIEEEKNFKIILSVSAKPEPNKETFSASFTAKEKNQVLASVPAICSKK